MGPERSLSAVAGKLGKTKHLMEKWSVRYAWQARMMAYQEHVALVELKATEAVATEKATDWISRQNEQREEEWRVRAELLEAGREALRRWKANENRCGSLEGIARMLELASKLGRLASGMPTDRTEMAADVTAKLDVEWDIALKKVYGEPLEPKPIVDVEGVSMVES